MQFKFKSGLHHSFDELNIHFQRLLINVLNMCKDKVPDVFPDVEFFPNVTAFYYFLPTCK